MPQDMTPKGIDLSGLKDIHLPELPPLFPPPVTAYIIVLCVALFIIGLFFTIKRLRKMTAKKFALREINRLKIQTGESPYKTALAVSSLMRRAALAVYPKQQIAPLYGKAWRQFLVKTAGKEAFKGKAGAVLETIQYAPEKKFQGIDMTPLLDDCADWIRHNL